MLCLVSGSLSHCLGLINVYVCSTALVFSMYIYYKIRLQELWEGGEGCSEEKKQWKHLKSSAGRSKAKCGQKRGWVEDRNDYH